MTLLWQHKLLLHLLDPLGDGVCGIIPIPLVPRGNTEALLHGGNMRLGELGGVIVNMTSNGQAPAFNSVGQDSYRSILDLRSSGKSLENLGDVVPPQIHEQFFERGIVHSQRAAAPCQPQPRCPIPA